MLGRLVLSLCLLALLAPLTPLAAANAPQSEQELLDRFLRGQAAADFDAIAELINWDRVSRFKRRVIRGYAGETFGRAVLSARFEPADAGALADFRVGERRYGANHPVSSLLRLELEGPVPGAGAARESVVFMVGEHADGVQIAIAVTPATALPTAGN